MVQKCSLHIVWYTYGRHEDHCHYDMLFGRFKLMYVDFIFVYLCVIKSYRVIGTFASVFGKQKTQCFLNSKTTLHPNKFISIKEASTKYKLSHCFTKPEPTQTDSLSYVTLNLLRTSLLVKWQYKCPWIARWAGRKNSVVWRKADC